MKVQQGPLPSSCHTRSRGVAAHLDHRIEPAPLLGQPVGLREVPREGAGHMNLIRLRAVHGRLAHEGEGIRGGQAGPAGKNTDEVQGVSGLGCIFIKREVGMTEVMKQTCSTCDGKGAVVLLPSGMLSNCPDCIENGLCPNCGRKTIVDEKFACKECGFPHQ